MGWNRVRKVAEAGTVKHWLQTLEPSMQAEEEATQIFDRKSREGACRRQGAELCVSPDPQHRAAKRAGRRTAGGTETLSVWRQDFGEEHPAVLVDHKVRGAVFRPQEAIEPANMRVPRQGVAEDWATEDRRAQQTCKEKRHCAA